MTYGGNDEWGRDDVWEGMGLAILYTQATHSNGGLIVLEQFKVGHEEAEFVRGEELKATVSGIFRRLGVPEDDAELGADVLVLADLRGVDSHGVSNMLRSYVSGYQDGSINPRPDWRVIRETPSTATVDSDRGLGTIITPKAMNIAIEKARNVGVGMVTIGNARHLGMASYHSMLALPHDMIGVCMTSCPPSGAAYLRGRAAAGNQPHRHCRAYRRGGALRVRRRHQLRGGQQDTDCPAPRAPTYRPAGWPRRTARPSWSRSPLPDNYWLLPVGGSREGGSHKGYGLSCVVDILAGVLTGFGYGAVPGRPNFGHYVAAYSVDAFTDVAHFKQEMDEWVRMMNATKPAPGHDRVIVAGQPEAEMEAIRRDEGIPLHPEVSQSIRDICAELGAPCGF